MREWTFTSTVAFSRCARERLGRSLGLPTQRKMRTRGRMDEKTGSRGRNLMAVPKRPTTPTSSAGLHWQITDDGSRTLWDERLDETYHSGCGAVAESLVVYLLNSGVH